MSTTGPYRYESDGFRGPRPAPTGKRGRMNLHEQAADAATAVCGLSFLAGCTIAQINQYLQAGAFIVAMISGACAAYYYLRKAHQK